MVNIEGFPIEFIRHTVFIEGEGHKPLEGFELIIWQVLRSETIQLLVPVSSSILLISQILREDIDPFRATILCFIYLCGQSMMDFWFAVVNAMHLFDAVELRIFLVLLQSLDRRCIVAKRLQARRRPRMTSKVHRILKRRIIALAGQNNASISLLQQKLLLRQILSLHLFLQDLLVFLPLHEFLVAWVPLSLLWYIVQI